MRVTSRVVVRFTAQGFHRWDSAPPHREYLGSKHRHLFYVEVSVTVRDLDREIEFHDLLEHSEVAWHTQGLDLGGASCEMMALRMLHSLQPIYGKHDVTVSVFEDGEVGALVEYLAADNEGGTNVQDQ